MKKKFVGEIPKILFVSLSGFLFLLWLNSFVDWNFEDITTKLKVNQQEALASETDFQEAYKDSFLEDDTLVVVDTSAAPGDSFWLTIDMVNTVPLLAFDFILIYDTNLIYPVLVDTYEVFPCDTDTMLPCTSWTIEGITETTDRTNPYDFDWLLFNAKPNQGRVDSLKFRAMINVWNPWVPLEPGTGPVVRILFEVNDTVTPGRRDSVRFALWDFESGNYANSFTDTAMYFLIPETRGGRFTVADTGGPPPNHYPVFAFLPDTSVNEGTTLEFWVTATDEDNDTIYLSLESFSPPPPGANYHFTPDSGVGSVTQKFDYTPGFDEAPATRFATFKATDEHGYVTTETVRIEVLETAQDLLMATSQQGGVPGSADRWVPFLITNSVDIYGLQFTFRWDDTRLIVDSIVRTDAIEGFSMYTNLGDSAGKATILIFGLAGETIPAGVDTVVYPSFRVFEDAEPGEVDILIENAREAINPGYPSQPLGMVNGKFIIDMFGDANLDQMVDVGDVVTLVGYILGEVTFILRQEMTADANRDSVINVGDLVAMIDIILGRWMGPSPPMYPGPMAIVKLDYEDLQPGSSGEVRVMADLEVPVAGAQLQIDYDPDKVSFQAPRLSERSDHFMVEYRDDKNGKLTLVLYNMSNDPIPVGEGNILSLPVMLSPDAEDELEIELKEVVLADQQAVLIPVGGQSPSVPMAFELSQNYPNPFNPSTTIKFTLPSPADGGPTLPTTLKIYNVLGEVVRNLVDESMAPGVHHVIWDGRDEEGNQVASGIYFYRLRAGALQDTKKMVLMK